MQLPLYALAATELLLADRDALPWQAGYWYIREGGFKPRKGPADVLLLTTAASSWNPAGKDSATAWPTPSMGLAAGIRGGPVPRLQRRPRCTGRCPYSTICRINQVRALDKTCQPSATQ